MGKRRDEEEGGVLWDGVIEGMPLFVKELIAGGVAGGFAKTVVAPLERVKILFQVQFLYSLIALRSRVLWIFAVLVSFCSLGSLLWFWFLLKSVEL